MIERARLPDRHPAALRLVTPIPGTKTATGPGAPHGGRR